MLSSCSLDAARGSGTGCEPPRGQLDARVPEVGALHPAERQRDRHPHRSGARYRPSRPRRARGTCTSTLRPAGSGCSRSSWSIASGELPSLRRRASARWAAGGAGGHDQAACAPRSTPAVAGEHSDRAEVGGQARSCSSRRSPESSRTQTLGAQRRARTARRSGSCACRRDRRRRAAPPCRGRRRCRCRRSRRDGLPGRRRRRRRSARRRPCSRTTTRAAVDPRSATARLQRCRQSLRTPTCPPAIAMAAQPATIAATSSRCRAMLATLMRRVLRRRNAHMPRRSRLPCDVVERPHRLDRAHRARARADDPTPQNGGGSTSTPSSA